MNTITTQPTPTRSAMRRALLARRDAAPHAADRIPFTLPLSKCRPPDARATLRALRDMPLVSLQLGPTCYRVRDCWEVYDLMVRNLVYGPGAPLRIDRARWDARLAAALKPFLPALQALRNH